MKRANYILVFVLTALLLLAFGCPVAASAAELRTGTAAFNPDLTAGSNTQQEALLALNSETDGFDFDAIYEYLQDALENYQTSITLQQFNIPADQIQALVDYIGNEMPEAFHVGHTFSYRTKNGCISALSNISYRYTQEEYAQKLAVFRQNAAWLLRDLSSSALTDVEKALVIHDRIITWTDYGYCGDYTTDSICFTAEGPLLTHEGVCSGYAKLYRYLLCNVGIASQYVTSSAMDHAWNIININGQWYHVDTTWDDGDAAGRVFHENFLRSTAGIQDTGHTADDFTTAPVSTTYDNAYWQNSLAEFVWFQNTLYYIDSVNGGLCKRSSGTSQKLLTLNDSWGGWMINKLAASQSSSYYRYYYGLSANSKYLYYSTPTKVYQLSLPSLTATSVYTPTIASGSYLFGSNVRDWELTAQIGTNPNSITQTQVIQLPREYTVAYDANGGSGAPEPQTKQSNQALTLSAAEPTRADYLFDGWNTQADGLGAAYLPGALYTADADVTLYAQWRRETPVISPAAGGVLVNKANHYIYGLRVGSTAADCLSVSNGSLGFEYSNPNQILGTGTKVNVYDADQILVDTYTVVVYGDVSGDGWYDGTDAYFIRLYTNGMFSKNALTAAQLTACDANHDDKIDMADAKLVEQAGLLLAGVDQSANNEDLVMNSVYLEYCGLIDQSGEISEPETQRPAADEEFQPAAPSVWSRIEVIFRSLLRWLLGLFTQG